MGFAMPMTLMSRYVVKLDWGIKTIEEITIKKKWALAGCCPTAPESGWWVVQYFSKEWQLHTNLVTDFLSDAVTWRCASTTVNLEEHSWYFDTSGERPFYFKKANFCHSGIPRNEAFSVWSWDFFVTACASILSDPCWWQWGLVFRCFWEAVGTHRCRWLAHGWLLGDRVLCWLCRAVSCTLGISCSSEAKDSAGHRWGSSPADTPLSFREWTKQERH